MFQFMRWRARSAKGRPNCTRPALEELETRDVPAAHAGLAGLALPVGGPTVAVAAQATTNKDSEGPATQIPAFFNGKAVTINVLQLSDKAAASIISNNPPRQTI